MNKFYNLYNLVMEDLKKSYNFNDLKKQAVAETSKFCNSLKENPIINDVLNLSSKEDFNDFLNDTYRNIIKGAKQKFEGDIREMSTSLKIEDNKKILNVNEKNRKFKEFKKSHPDATIEDYKIHLIRSNASKLDDIAKLYPPEFKQLIEIYTNRDKLGIGLEELIDKDIVEVISKKYASYDLSKDFILRLFNFNNIKKNGANIGAGEFLICLFVKNSEWPVDNCDVAINGQKYEIKGKQAKVGEVNSPIDILNETLNKIKNDYLNKTNNPLNLKNYKCFSKEALTVAAYRQIFNFKTGNGNIFDENGIIGIVRNLYNYDQVNSDEKLKIDTLITSYLNYFYPKNIIGESSSNLYQLADIQSNDFSLLQNKYFIKVLNNYKAHLNFNGLIFIGDDHLLHLFNGDGEELLNKMLPYIDINSPRFQSLETQNFSNRIIMKKK